MDLFEQNDDKLANRFDAVTEFPGHVGFARKLLESYKWDEETVQKLTAELDALQAKHDDRFLNLSVIGEFSTGKSTFINALLRRSGFLESGSLQGTTKTATIIENSDAFALILTYKDGNKDTQEFESCEELKECVANISLDEERASSLYSVTIQLPAPLLRKLGFRIIDTPGVNSNERWHDDVTIRTIEEMSDLSIIIIDASKPLPQQFCDFINSNLEHILGSCVFVVTKVNVIRKRELEEVMKYIKSKAQKEFNIADPLVLPYSSADVIENLEKLDNSIDLPELIAASLKSEKTMMEHMSMLKPVVQTLELIKIADKIYGMLQNHLDEIAQEQNELMRKMEKMRALPSKMEEFVNQNFEPCCHMYNDAIVEVSARITEFVKNEFQYSHKRILNEMSAINSTYALSNYIEQDFQFSFSDEMRLRMYKINSKSQLITDEYKKATSAFIKRFTDNFKSDIYSETIEERYSSSDVLFGYMCFPMLIPVSFYVSQYTHNKGIIGTIIPKNSKDSVLAEGLNNFMNIVNSCYTNAYYACMEDINCYITKTRSLVENTISSFSNEYRRYVIDSINEDNAHAFDETIKSIQADVSEINARKEKLNVISQMLSIMSRKG